jgi:glycerol-3-phosphate O-acyltransferase/dihydroxyacetone phosphate acyltransferase
LKTRIENYQKELDELGIRDYQVTGLSHEQSESEADFVLRKMRIPFRIAELLLLLLVSLIPSLFLNVPVGIIAHRWAVMRKENALARSKVKIEALDVMLTEKVVLCIVLVPSLWIFYGLMLWILTDIDYPKLLLFMYSFPVAAYMGIVTTEAGMIELKDLKPMLKRLFPSTRKRMKKLPAEQKKLRKDLRDFINTIGPTLGDVYSEKKIDWADFQQNLRNERKNSTANLEKMKDE